MTEFVTSLGVLITANTEEEARASMERSGVVVGALIGEVLIEQIEPLEEL